MSDEYNTLDETADLHEVAGLTYAGKDEDGLDSWVGTKQDWANYERLANEEAEKEQQGSEDMNYELLEEKFF